MRRQLLGVVPLVERARLVDALVALQPDQAGAGGLGDRLGQLGLADPGRALRPAVACRADRPGRRSSRRPWKPGTRPRPAGRRRPRPTRTAGTGRRSSRPSCPGAGRIVRPAPGLWTAHRDCGQLPGCVRNCRGLGPPWGFVTTTEHPTDTGPDLRRRAEAVLVELAGPGARLRADQWTAVQALVAAAHPRAGRAAHRLGQVGGLLRGHRAAASRRSRPDRHRLAVAGADAQPDRRRAPSRDPRRHGELVEHRGLGAHLRRRSRPAWSTCCWSARSG